MEPMRFDFASPQEIPCEINGKRYVLKEATSEVACKWRNFQAKQARLSNQGGTMQVVGVGDVADSEPLLVSLCLCAVLDDKDGKPYNRPVPLDVVKSWPAKVVKSLFEKAKELGDLAEGENPLRNLLLTALDRGDGPTTLYLFREWCDNLVNEDAKYKPLADLVKPTQEEDAKN